jgi:hypothetical protein
MAALQFSCIIATMKVAVTVFLQENCLLRQPLLLPFVKALKLETNKLREFLSKEGNVIKILIKCQNHGTNSYMKLLYPVKLNLI